MDNETGNNPIENQSETINGVYIPMNIEACFLELIKILKKDDIKILKELETKDECSWRYHMGLGLYLRNNWGLWADSRLQKYFRERFCFHADDISSMILCFYWEWLNGIDDNWKKFELKI
jgi:hypothetical protein